MAVVTEAINGIQELSSAPGSAQVLVASKGVDRKIKLNAFAFGFSNTSLTAVIIDFKIGGKTLSLQITPPGGQPLVIGPYNHQTGGAELQAFTLYERDPNGNGFRLQKGLLAGLTTTTPSATPFIVPIKSNFPAHFPDELWLPANEEISWEPTTLTGTGVVAITFLGVAIER